ncbi:MAG TPA: hypothetical protein VLF89_06640 [Candidatus Saccharimonadales bacterium]|nr:hypothetical protein [Candidatus Saccharimonadales bacterium]
MEKKAKQIIIKLGRSITTNDDDSINSELFMQLAKQIKELHDKNYGVILVVSGAVVAGKKRLTHTKHGLHKGLLANLGQIILINEINALFANEDILTGQMLLTKNDISDENKVSQIKEIINTAVANNIVLVFNENDAVEYGTFLGNDFLAATLTKITPVDTLLLLTDVEGVLDKNMQVLKTLTTAELDHIATIEKENDKGEVGGMRAKIEAALIAKATGTKCIIAHGKTENILTKVFINNESIGTTIL